MKISGKKEFQARLKAIPDVARKDIRKALDRSAQEIENAVRSFAPVMSGDLKRSVGYTFGKFTPENSNVRGVGVSAKGGIDDPDLTVSVHAGDAKAYYAAMVEFGTKKMDPQPYFLPAYRLNKKRAIRRINRAVRESAKKVARGSRS